MRTTNGIRTESARTPNASRAGALHSHIHSHIHSHETPGRKPASIVTAVDARLATIAATRSHSPAPTMNGPSALIGGGR